MVGGPNRIAEPRIWFELVVVDLDPLRAAICAVGEFDLAAREALSEVLQQQMDAGRRIVRLDLSRVTFLDCSCLGVLAASHRRFLEVNGLLVLTGVDARTAQILNITHLDKTLFVISIDQDPFGDALITRAARPRHLPNQRRTSSAATGSRRIATVTNLDGTPRQGIAS